MSNRQYLRQSANEFTGGFQPKLNTAGGATPTPDFTAADSNVITLSANATIGAPTFPSPLIGDEICIVLIEDATGSRTVAWNAIYKNAPAWTAGAAGTRASAKFHWNGIAWQFDGGSSAFA